MARNIPIKAIFCQIVIPFLEKTGIKKRENIRYSPKWNILSPKSNPLSGSWRFGKEETESIIIPQIIEGKYLPTLAMYGVPFF